MNIGSLVAAVECRDYRVAVSLFVPKSGLALFVFGCRNGAGLVQPVGALSIDTVYPFSLFVVTLLSIPSTTLPPFPRAFLPPFPSAFLPLFLLLSVPSFNLRRWLRTTLSCC